jgi:hypothetical protein
MLNRIYNYDERGRYESEEEAIQIDANIEKILHENKIDFLRLDPTEESIKALAWELKKEVEFNEANYINEVSLETEEVIECA